MSDHQWSVQFEVSDKPFNLGVEAPNAREAESKAVDKFTTWMTQHDNVKVFKYEARAAITAIVRIG